ncbi:MAG: DUF2851 family protein [Bacteroidia bacterium]|nr:DUF2851 family protein [Bacteroidia bacterium]
MKEEVLHRFWNPKFLGQNTFKLVGNQLLEVQFFGDLNLLQGPDFKDFRAKIDGQLFAGFMEMHLLSSDWLKHQHYVDPKYDNVVLHVVWEDDLKLNPIRNKEGQILPTLELSRYFSKKDLQNVQMEKVGHLLCEYRIIAERNLNEINEIIEIQKKRAVLTKLEIQKKKIHDILEYTQYDWEQTAWIWLGSYWVDPQNRLSAERVFRTMSLNKMKRGKWEDVLVEILYRFGLFEATPDLPIFRQIIPMVQSRLKYLEEHLRDERELLPWYHGKVRYHNYPLVKFIQYLSFVAHLDGDLTELFRNLDSWSKLGKSYQVIDYKFGFSKLASDQVSRIAVNAWLPLLLVYRDHKGESIGECQIFDLMRIWKPEMNGIVKKFNNIDRVPLDAFDSFSRISMWQNWCSVKKCSNCEIGKSLWNV